MIEGCRGQVEVVRFLSFGLSGDYGSLLYAGCVGDCRDTWLAMIGHANQILLCKDFAGSLEENGSYLENEV